MAKESLTDKFLVKSSWWQSFSLLTTREHRSQWWITKPWMLTGISCCCSLWWWCGWWCSCWSGWWSGLVGDRSIPHFYVVFYKNRWLFTEKLHCQDCRYTTDCRSNWANPCSSFCLLWTCTYLHRIVISQVCVVCFCTFTVLWHLLIWLT